jgi:hypothetical protein
MSRLVWPYLFTLRAGNLLAAPKERNLGDVRAKYFASSNGISVIALRWSTTPNLGFPREPFQVFRRTRNTLEGLVAVTVLSTPTAVTQAQTFAVLPRNDVAYVVLVEVQVAASQNLTIQAMDVNALPIPNQVVTLTQNGFAEFRCPGIASVSISGTGILVSIRAVSENLYANLPDWTLIQTVGLPLEANEIGTFYKTNPQGIWPNPVTPPTLTGILAAEIRVLLTALLEVAPPPTGIADFPLPAWPQPNASAYVANIRNPDSFVPMIEHCLENSVDADPSRMQSSYSEVILTEGLSQIGATIGSPSGSPSQVTLPVTNVAMLAVSTDPYAAVGLGYGTLDIPPETDPGKISVAITPNPATVAVGGAQQFTATVSGATNNSVIWSVNGLPGGDATVGTITSTGLYTGPAVIPASNPVSAMATSAEDPSRSAGSNVTVVADIILRPPPGKPLPGPVPSAPTSVTATPSSVAPAPPPPAPATPTPAAPTADIIVHPPPPTYPPADNYGNFDYMVTAPYVFPFGFTLTLAGLSTGQLPVSEASGLTSTISDIHAPLQRDQPVPAAIRVTWNAPPVPQGYAILASRASNQSEVLNAPRPAAVGGYDVFVGLPPANPDPNTPPDQQNPAFSDLEAALPLAAPAINNRYLVAAQDIFGQWSGWVSTSTSLSPAPVTKPGLRSAEFLYTANAGSPPSAIVPATLRIDFGWDWQDRAPGQIRFTGKFVPATATTLDPAYLGGFALTNTGSIGAPVILTFSYTAVNPDTVNSLNVIPTITSGHTSNGPVAILGLGSPPAPASPNQIQYRVELTGIELDFSTSNELDFLLYATATEEVQPGVWSDPIDQPSSNTPASPAPPPLFIGKIVRAINPNPPVVTFAPPPINWTALPDATGSARGVLQWQVDPTAQGYYVWEATESALLHLLPPGVGTADPPPGTPYPTRATTLKALLDTYQDASLQGFARLTQSPIAASSTEITLPGSAETMYVYRISAIGQNNVESTRSPSVAIFAVPHRNTPGTPRIMLRSSASPSGIQVIVLPVQTSAAPAGYRLFRVLSQVLSQNVSTMGPAKYDENSPLWQDYNGSTLAGSPLTGKSLLDTAAVPSWYPYYYRATVVGEDDPTNGAYQGESPYSSVQVGYSLPAGPPLILSFTASISAPKSAALIKLTTDLPAAAASPVGAALVELLQLVHTGSPFGPLTLKQNAAKAPNLIPIGTLSLPLLPPASISFARSASNASGEWDLYILLPYSPAQANTFVVRLTDPLARQSTASF